LLKKKGISTFSKNSLKLLSGNIVGQVINVITIPLIARMFSKEALGANELLISVISTLFISASMRYESAIVLSEDEEEEEGLFFLSTTILIFFSTVLTFILLVFSDTVLALFNAEKLKNIYFIIVIGVFLKGFQQIGERVLVKNGKFKELSICSIADVGSNKIMALLVGSFYSAFTVLWSCYLFGVFVSLFYTLKEIRKYSIRKYDINKLVVLLKKYKKFPFVNNFSVFLNNFSIQIPVLVISSRYGLEYVAIYGYAHRIAMLPVNLLATSLGKVYYQEASVKFLKDKKSLGPLYIGLQKKLMLLGMSIVAGIQVFASPAIHIFLGPEWQGVIPVLRMMSVFVFFRLLCTPLASTLTVIDKQEAGLIIIVLSTVIRFLALSIFDSDFQNTILIYTFAVSAFYVFYNLTMFLLMKRAIK